MGRYGAIEKRVIFGWIASSSRKCGTPRDDITLVGTKPISLVVKEANLTPPLAPAKGRSKFRIIIGELIIDKSAPEAHPPLAGPKPAL